ncbi:hypothetical protein FACS189425_06710 [Clostridia bacterium]|nr:hypothetical protein FACS189425_06710 [Clostridia bacterium]
MSKKGYTVTDPQEIYRLLYEPSQITIQGLLLQREVERNNLVGIQLRYIECGNVLELELIPIFKKRVAGFENQTIAIDSEKRAEMIARANKKHRQRYFVRLINTNFTDGDTIAHLGYDDAHLPTDMKSAKKFFSLYIDRLRRYAKKVGINFKYIYVTEVGLERGRIHHHFICNLPRDIVKAQWKGGNPQRDRFDEAVTDELGITGFATYITEDKNLDKSTGDKKWERDKYEKSYVPSLNLEQPTTRTANTKISRRQAAAIATDDNMAKDVFERLYPDWRFIDKRVSWSDVISGCYIYIRMSRRRKKSKKEIFQKPRKP